MPTTDVARTLDGLYLSIAGLPTPWELSEQ